MRELKFRCWDSVGNHGMQYFDSLQEIADYYRGHKYSAEMQYTGLKDKNGKEIYEGDILKHKTIKSNIVVEYFYAGFDPFCDSLDAEYGFGDTDSENYIVIGNIYENPELLEKK